MTMMNREERLRAIQDLMRGADGDTPLVAADLSEELPPILGLDPAETMGDDDSMPPPPVDLPAPPPPVVAAAPRAPVQNGAAQPVSSNAGLILPASIILRGIIGRPSNHARPTLLPRSSEHVKQAAQWTRDLSRIFNGRPLMVAAGAELLSAYFDNPRSQHCSKEELFAYAVEAVRRLETQFP